MHGDDDDGVIREPENAKVDDWFGQDVERDTQVAERVARESDSEEEAEARFEQEASGEEHQKEAYPRPEGEREGGDGGPT